MATVKYTDASSVKNIKPSYIVATLFAGTETDDTPIGDTYVLEDVVEDTTSMSQDDNETTDIECETSDNPIISVVKSGKYQFAAEVADTQTDLLKALVGFEEDATGKKVYAPAKYTKRYAKVDVVFENADGTLNAYVIPKLQLNSKLLIESLNSNIGRISLAGTAQNITVTVNGKKVQTPFYVDNNYTLPSGE